MLAAVDQGDVHAGARGDVGEFKADVAAADQHQPFGRRLPREKVIRWSITATDQPTLRQLKAVTLAAVPLPITMRS